MDPEKPNDAPAQDPAPAKAPTPAKVPKWDGEFDRERAERLIANLRAELDEVKGRLKNREDAEKSELQRAIERAEAAESRASELEIKTLVAEAVTAHKLPPHLAKYVTGKTAEEIAESAKSLAADFGVSADSDPDPQPERRPKPRLVPGHTDPADAAPDFDPAALAARIDS